jgi:outer membrane protein assembly factor BamD (BamD/ComL family)
MNIIRIMLSLAVVIGLAGAGCGQSAASRVERSFASAEPAAKESAEKAVQAVNAGNFTEAMAHLTSLAGKAKLTPEQQQAVKDLIAELQEKLKAEVSKATEGAQKALGDLKKSFGK